MSTDFSIRPVGSPVPTPADLPASPAVNDAVRTELPPGQTVSAADVSDAVRTDPGQTESDADMSHQAYYDRSAGSLVFQLINRRTDAVVEQFPDDAVLRRRAYFHMLDMKKEETTRVIPTDRTA